MTDDNTNDTNTTHSTVTPHIEKTGTEEWNGPDPLRYLIKHIKNLIS